MEDIQKYYIRKNDEDIAWDKIEEDIFIIFTKENEEKVFKLNKTSAYLWENCDGTKRVEDLADALCLKYNVEEKTALDDTIKFIDQMRHMQLISLSKSPT